MKVTVAGASGFIGSKLTSAIVTDFEVCGLSRKTMSDTNVKWKITDLFSYQSVNESLKDCDVAIYLVHSMLPATRLFQGNFADTDLFLADNFARACKKNDVKQIIYLGGLVPHGKESKHLSSRREVEDVFKSTGIPVTILRAGMVVGNGGSSFEILKNLVLNLPFMILPKWTKSLTQVIYINDLVRVIKFCCANKEMFNKTINIVTGESLSYEMLIRKCVKHFKGSIPIINVPINYTSFSKLWVCIFGQTQKELVSPLIDSLLCDISHYSLNNDIQELIKYRSFDQMLKNINKEKVIRKKRKLEHDKSVRSIQRLGQSKALSAIDVSDMYARWLPKYFKNLIVVKEKGDELRFQILGVPLPLLILHRQEQLKSLERIKFHIVGGLLTQTTNTGWLEFRIVGGDKFVLASINDFVPSLPWYLYKYGQALMHLFVMKRFSKYLSTKN